MFLGELCCSLCGLANSDRVGMSEKPKNTDGTLLVNTAAYVPVSTYQYRYAAIITDQGTVSTNTYFWVFPTKARRSYFRTHFVCCNDWRSNSLCLLRSEIRLHPSCRTAESRRTWDCQPFVTGQGHHNVFNVLYLNQNPEYNMLNHGLIMTEDEPMRPTHNTRSNYLSSTSNWARRACSSHRRNCQLELELTRIESKSDAIDTGIV